MVLTGDNTINKARKLLAPSNRGEIAPFIAMDVLASANEREAAGENIIHMEVGQPGTRAPRPVIEAAERALKNDRLGYTEALGVPALRERIAKHYLDYYSCSIAPERVIITTGSSAGFVLSFLALFDAQARVALPSPGYPSYRHILKALGIVTQTIETTAETRWMPIADNLEAMVQSEDLDGLLLASPANPTGTMLIGDGLAKLAEACGRLGLWFISDEIYHGLNYEVPAQTALSYSDNAVVINSFSKYFSMTGWRIGWMIVPENLVRTIERLAQNLYISPPALSQFAAIAAFESFEETEAYKAVYEKNREILLNELPKMGLTGILPADGAFYLYVDVQHLTDDSLSFAKRMLDEIGVAVTPGLDFDPERGQYYIRFSYAGKTGDMTEAVRRLRGWVK